MCPGFGRKEVVEFLLENGAKVDSQDDGKCCVSQRPGQKGEVDGGREKKEKEREEGWRVSERVSE